MRGRFNAQVLDRLARDIALETALRELKLLLYKVDVPSNRAEMIRDVIALANTARRRGDPARLIFGIGEKPSEIFDTIEVGSVHLLGVDGQYIRERLPGDWQDLDPSEQIDRIDRELHQILQKYISPEPDWDYCAGLWHERLVAYMEIRPAIEGPFRVRQKIEYEDAKGRKKKLRANDSWVRSGSQKQFVDQSQWPLLYCYRDVPYVSPSEWQAYAADCATEFKEPSPEFHVPMNCLRAGETVNLGQAVEDFLEESHERVMYICGGPGAGKTLFLKDVMYRTSQHLVRNLEALSERLLVDEQPQVHIPVWLDLNRRRFCNERDLALQLANSLDQFRHLRLDRSDNPENVFEDENLQFVVLLDALDEMQPEEGVWQSSLESIRLFIENHKKLKVIVTSRPSGVREKRRGWNIVTVAGIQKDVLGSTLNNHLRDPFPVFEMLDSYPDILVVASVPLALETMLEYVRRREKSGQPLTIAGLVGWIIDRLFSHESKKDSAKDRDLRMLQRISSLAELAWWMDGRYPYADYVNAATKLGAGNEEIGRDNIQRIAEMELLEITTEGIVFSSETVKTYFASRKLKRILDQRLDTDWHELSLDYDFSNEFWHNCWNMIGQKPPGFLISQRGNRRPSS